MALQKREKTLLKALGIIVVVSGIILFFVYRTPQNQEPTPSTTQTATQQQTPDQPEAQQPSRPRATAPSGGGSGGRVSSQPTQAIISIDEFQRHNSYDDCWVLIRGTVYDITDYLLKHSNRREASPYCGTYAFEEGFLGSSDVLVNEIIEQSSKIGTMG